MAKKKESKKRNLDAENALEMTAITTVNEVLRKLPADSAIRVLSYMADKYCDATLRFSSQPSVMDTLLNIIHEHLPEIMKQMANSSGPLPAPVKMPPDVMAELLKTGNIKPPAPETKPEEGGAPPKS